MKEALQVGTAIADPGSRAVGYIKVDTLANGNEVCIPVIVVNGASEGPVLWLNAALHGNEFNGVLASIQATNGIDAKQLRGAVVCTPVSNPLAFQGKQRFSLYDQMNLGECYPGNAKGQMTERIAYAHFLEVKRKATCLVDYHASGVTNFAAPYSVLKLCGHPETERKAEELLLAFGIHLNCKINTMGELNEPVPVNGSLDLECMRNGIPSFMLELGHAGRLEPDIVEFAIKGTNNIMKHLRMIPGEADIHHQQVVVNERYIIRSNTSGIVVQEKKPHDFVRKGERIAHIIDLFGNVVETIVAPKDVYLISLKEDCVANAGDRIAFGGSV